MHESIRRVRSRSVSAGGHRAVDRGDLPVHGSAPRSNSGLLIRGTFTGFTSPGRPDLRGPKIGPRLGPLPTSEERATVATFAITGRSGTESMRLVVGVSAVLAVGIAAQVPSQASASTPDAAGLVAIARSYLEARAAALVMGSGTSQARASLAAVPMAAPLQTETSQAITVLAARRQADHAGGVDYIRAVVALLHPAISTESDGTTTLHVTDDTRLYFKPIRGAPPHEEWSVGRTFTFKQGASVPVLVGARLTDSSGPLMTVDVAPGETAGGAANSGTRSREGAGESPR
jgi:hypothetical protein